MIACPGEISSRCYQQGLCDTVRSPVGCLAKGSCPNPVSHVSSAAFAQAWLRPSSPSVRSAQAQLTLSTRRGAAKTNLTRNHQLLTRGPKWPPPSQGSQICYHYYAHKYKDYNLRRCFNLPILKNSRPLSLYFTIEISTPPVTVLTAT
jgi:hypothetical protein